MANSHGAQVPEVDTQTQLFGVNPGPPSPIARMMYHNGTLHRNHDSLLELDKALNYEVRVVTGNSNKPYVRCEAAPLASGFLLLFDIL